MTLGREVYAELKMTNESEDEVLCSSLVVDVDSFKFVGWGRVVRS